MSKHLDSTNIVNNQVFDNIDTQIMKANIKCFSNCSVCSCSLSFVWNAVSRKYRLSKQYFFVLTPCDPDIEELIKYMKKDLRIRPNAFQYWISWMKQVLQYISKFHRITKIFRTSFYAETVVQCTKSWAVGRISIFKTCWNLSFCMVF